MSKTVLWKTPIDLKIDLKQLNRMMIKAPEITAHEFHDAFDHIKRKFFKVFRGEVYSKFKSRGLFKAFQGYIDPRVPGRKPEKVKMSIVTYSSAAEIYEQGGIIRPKVGKYLTIPIGDAATKKGKTKKRYKDMKYAKLFRVNVGNKRFLATTIKKQTRFLFILKRYIKVKPRLNFYSTWYSLTQFRNVRLQTALDRVVKKMVRVK